MKLRKLTLVNFKNIATACPSFSAGINCIVGENGAGKTNVLDAVHYLSMCKSSLGMTDRQSLRHGEEFFVVEGEYSDDGDKNLSVVCSFSGQGGKKFKFCGKEYERLSDHVGVVPVVVVSPADVFLVSDAADERRRYLNSFISQLDREYLQTLVRYNTVLAERNRLLKQPLGGAGIEILDVLDGQLAQHGSKIHARRAGIVDELRPLVADYYRTLSDDREEVGLRYRSELNDSDFGEVLARARQKDVASQFTTSGIHRDDVVMTIGGHPLKRYGSQGQQKSFLVALKLAQYMIVSDALGEKPILLLDDLFDKLDTGRVERLISLVATPHFGQIFISDCNRARLEEILRRGGREYSLFMLRDGEIVEEQ
ncbi:MAG: DNA replication and repair protein RecF [Rikenellaceae bacterium]|jgi:DNA replication and repair protein RecF|nr:DNA replication and repair protein RecF [Rikenellaceae bacterium]